MNFHANDAATRLSFFLSLSSLMHIVVQFGPSPRLFPPAILYIRWKPEDWSEGRIPINSAFIIATSEIFTPADDERRAQMRDQYRFDTPFPLIVESKKCEIVL